MNIPRIYNDMSLGLIFNGKSTMTGESVGNITIFGTHIKANPSTVNIRLDNQLFSLFLRLCGYWYMMRKDVFFPASISK